MRAARLCSIRVPQLRNPTTTVALKCEAAPPLRTGRCRFVYITNICVWSSHLGVGELGGERAALPFWP